MKRQMMNKLEIHSLISSHVEKIKSRNSPKYIHLSDIEDIVSIETKQCIVSKHGSNVRKNMLHIKFKHPEGLYCFAILVD